MSNVGRPLTGMKPCTHCGSTDRQSNGQCACRNAAYRAARKAATAGVEPAKKAAAPKKTAAPRVEDPKDRYVLVVGKDRTPYARKDAAIKNGIRTGKGWTVVRNGKTVADSKDI